MAKCINCSLWLDLKADGNSRVNPICDNPNSSLYRRHVGLANSCEASSPWTGDENDPLVSDEEIAQLDNA